MTVIEIILIIIGMLFILASFWVTEKLSPEELEHISELSREEMAVILERELDNSKQRVEQLVDETIDACKEPTERALEKQTNEKIMAINEFSDTVLEKMNKTHNEIMFLYSMLNDKHTELTDFSSGLTAQLQELRDQSEEMKAYYIDEIRRQGEAELEETQQIAAAAPKEDAPVSDEPKEPDVSGEPEEPAPEDEQERNIRQEVFELYEEGKDSVSIAKKLGMGVGEVRLILGLYKGEYSGEV